MYYCYLESPLGKLLLAGTRSSLKLISFPEGSMRREPDPGWTHSEAPFESARKQLDEYFAGERREFELSLDPDGTDFQMSVLRALRNIPYGSTATYGEIASAVGRPKAARAVGAANGRNPLPIVIPCHRVIGSNGDLTGFGGGISAKKTLLKLEQDFRP